MILLACVAPEPDPAEPPVEEAPPSLTLRSEIPLSFGRNVDGEGTLLAMAGGSTILMVDAADPAAPVVLAELDTLGALSDVELAGDLLYSASDPSRTDEATSVRIWDVGDPASPALLSTIDVPVDDAHRLAVRDDLLVLASTYNDVFAFWDVSDPASPARIAEWAPPVGEPHDQTFDGNRLWVAFTKGWACLDVTDPAAPVALFSAEADWEFPFVHNLAVAGSSVLMTEEKAGGTLRRWDTADLDAVTLTDSYQTHPDRSVHDVFVAGETAYAAWFNDGLLLFDLAGELVPVASYDTYEGDESAAGDGTANSHGASGVWADGDLVAVADTERGLLIFTY